MSMICNKLVWVEVEDTKKVLANGGHPSRGYIWENQVDNKDLWPIRVPYMVCHDLFEHQNGINCLGSVSDEIQAIGGSLQIREEEIEKGLIIVDVFKANIKNIASGLVGKPPSVIPNLAGPFTGDFVGKAVEQVLDMYGVGDFYKYFMYHITLGAQKALQKESFGIKILKMYERLEVQLYRKVPFFSRYEICGVKGFEIGISFETGLVDVRV